MIQKTVRGLAFHSPSYSTPPGFSFTPTGATSRGTGALRRAGTIVRAPLDVRKDKEKGPDGDMAAQEV
jgi:hypothetical protein